VGPRAVLDAVTEKKISLRRESNQSVVSRYTGSAILANKIIIIIIIIITTTTTTTTIHVRWFPYHHGIALPQIADGGKGWPCGLEIGG
jgi:hypothetical protein